MVTALFNRLGNAGVLLVASGLLLAGLAGAAVVHHYDSQSVASQQHEDQTGENRAGGTQAAEPEGNQQDAQGDQGDGAGGSAAGQDLQQTN